MAAAVADGVTVHLVDVVGYDGLPLGVTLLRTHHPDDCAGEHCSLHNPSRHALDHAPLRWRADRYLMERVCAHGAGHPDPDDTDYKRRTRGAEYARHDAEHACDGCCGTEPR